MLKLAPGFVGDFLLFFEALSGRFGLGIGLQFVAAGFEHAVEAGDVVEGEAFALVLAPDDVAQFDEVFDGRFGVISPDGRGF